MSNKPNSNMPSIILVSKSQKAQRQRKVRGKNKGECGGGEKANPPARTKSPLRATRHR
jgi:hypothetical protein